MDELSHLRDHFQVVAEVSVVEDPALAGRGRGCEEGGDEGERRGVSFLHAGSCGGMRVGPLLASSRAARGFQVSPLVDVTPPLLHLPQPVSPPPPHSLSHLELRPVEGCEGAQTAVQRHVLRRDDVAVGRAHLETGRHKLRGRREGGIHKLGK